MRKEGKAEQIMTTNYNAWTTTTNRKTRRKSKEDMTTQE